MTVVEGKNIIETKMKNCHAILAFPVKDGFIYSMKPDDWDDKQILADPFFKVTNSGEVEEYSPVMDPKEFREGIKNRVEFGKPNAK